MGTATDPTGWMNNPSPAGGTYQQQANAAADQIQIAVQGDGTQAWAAALNALPPGEVGALGLAAKDVAMIVADAAGGAIIAGSDAVASALATLGISTAVGAEAGPYGAAVGAAIGVVTAVATLPQASGSGPVPTPAQEQLAQAYLIAVDAQDLENWYWDIKILADNPGAGQGGFHVDLVADKKMVSMFYNFKIFYLFGTSPQSDALADNAMARMPPPDGLAQLLQANNVAWSQHGWPIPQGNLGGASDYGTDQLSPGSAITFTGIFAASAMAGASPQVMVALCKSLESAFAQGYIGPTDPRIIALQYLEAYYGTATFQGLGPQPGRPGFGPLHLPPPGAIQGGGSPMPTSTATKVAYGVAGTAAAAAVGTGIYAWVTKQAYSAVWNKIFGKAKRVVGIRR